MSTRHEKRGTGVHSPIVGLFADVIPCCASTIDSDIDIALLSDVPEDSFSHRRATDVAKAYNENFRCHVDTVNASGWVRCSRVVDRD
jgi:hypothetical protein